MTPITLKKVRTACDTDHDAIKVTLFKDERDRVCGWFIGPVRIGRSGVDIDYLPQGERALASLAVVRAIAAARHAGLRLCVVDPDDLWEPAWRT